jgi:hypothetical protein
VPGSAVVSAPCLAPSRTPAPCYWITSSAKMRSGRRKRDPERLRRLAVEDQLELRGLFHGEVGRLGACEQAIHIVGNAAQRVARAVRTS